VFIDDSLARFETVYPAAGTPSSMVRMSFEQLVGVVDGRMARISHD
jgi:prolyl-tRNA editing enzyme YbaK/EbsC (Cys-tRNA(Pro) deacylase)